MFNTVFFQVCILALLIAVGFFASKLRLLTEDGVKCCTDIVLILVTPCVIIKSLIREFDGKILRSLVTVFALSLLVQVVLAVMSNLIFHSKDVKRQRVLRFGTIFANCGFMSLPLQISLLGDDGALYGSAYIIMFNLIIWSYGIILISGDKKYISPKKLLVNPGILGLATGLLIFLFSIPVPNVIYSALDYLSALYTPLPMLIIGYHLSKSDVFKALFDPLCLLSVFIKMIVFPFVALALLFVIGVRGDMLVSITISVSAPVAAITTMFSSKYSADTPLSVNMVSLSTVLSVVTMPIVVTVARLLA